MAFGVKTNERPGTRSQVRYARMSAWKARVVLDLIRGKEVAEADSILQFSERDAAIVIRKCLASAVANAEHNNQLDADNLYVSACYADEGPTLKRWRPRARGRATRIRKRTCHITVIVSPLSADQLEARERREQARLAAGGTARTRSAAASRAARVARSRQADAPAVDVDPDELEATTDESIENEVEADIAEQTEAEVPDERQDAAPEDAADEAEGAEGSASDEAQSSEEQDAPGDTEDEEEE
jgi:large subunit ribosomal protein L22